MGKSVFDNAKNPVYYEMETIKHRWLFNESFCGAFF